MPLWLEIVLIVFAALAALLAIYIVLLGTFLSWALNRFHDTFDA